MLQILNMLIHIYPAILQECFWNIDWGLVEVGVVSIQSLNIYKGGTVIICFQVLNLNETPKLVSVKIYVGGSSRGGVQEAGKGSGGGGTRTSVIV